MRLHGVSTCPLSRTLKSLASNGEATSCTQQQAERQNRKLSAAVVPRTWTCPTREFFPLGRELSTNVQVLQVRRNHADGRHVLPPLHRSDRQARPPGEVYGMPQAANDCVRSRVRMLQELGVRDRCFVPVVVSSLHRSALRLCIPPACPGAVKTLPSPFFARPRQPRTRPQPGVFRRRFRSDN